MGRLLIVGDVFFGALCLAFVLYDWRFVWMLPIAGLAAFAAYKLINAGAWSER